MNQNIWTINKKSYDLTKFSHPGGKNIIEINKNTNCTNSFLSHHSFKEKATMNILKKYHIKRINTLPLAPTIPISKEFHNNTLFFRIYQTVNDYLTYFILIVTGLIILFLIKLK